MKPIKICNQKYFTWVSISWFISLKFQHLQASMKTLDDHYILSRFIFLIFRFLWSAISGFSFFSHILISLSLQLELFKRGKLLRKIVKKRNSNKNWKVKIENWKLWEKKKRTSKVRIRRLFFVSRARASSFSWEMLLRGISLWLHNLRQSFFKVLFSYWD